jgi:hypothetical protein
MTSTQTTFLIQAGTPRQRAQLRFESAPTPTMVTRLKDPAKPLLHIAAWSAQMEIRMIIIDKNNQY